MVAFGVGCVREDMLLGRLRTTWKGQKLVRAERLLKSVA